MRVSKLLVPATLLVSLVTIAEPADAHICWNLSPFDDIIEAEPSKVPGGEAVHLTGSWESEGNYFLPIVGVFLGTPTPGEFRFGIHGTNNTGFFGGFQDCTIDATFTLPSHSGPFKIDCGAGAFTATGTLVKVLPCAPDDAKPAKKSGTPAGQ